MKMFIVFWVEKCLYLNTLKYLYNTACILIFSYGENSCIRCLHLRMRSKNILQVLASSQETISKCYINEESAIATCPTPKSLKSHPLVEIILFSMYRD